jgi:hypothetical protein
MAEIAIAAIPKGTREEIRVSITEWKGAQLLSIRVWFPAADGEMRPGKDGLAVRIDRLPELADAIGKAHDAAMEAGLYDAVKA